MGVCAPSGMGAVAQETRQASRCGRTGIYLAEKKENVELKESSVAHQLGKIIERLALYVDAVTPRR
jgi:hypothetical protein